MTSDSNDVGRAIEKWVDGLPGDTDRGVLGDWLAIACFVSVNDRGHPAAEYYVVMRDGSLLPHVAEGLTERLRDELASMQVGNDDDEE